jgi:hypothetical protein
MNMKRESKSNQEHVQLFRRSVFRLLAVVLLIMTAFVIRLHHISRPPMDFQPIRQYMLAHNTRAPYLESQESVPGWRKEIARINKKRMGFEIEAPILDNAVVFGYRIMGGEHLWMPRVLSSIFWIIGGIFLYLIALRLSSSGAALFSAAFYLFLPFGISASRSFQPDPLMIMLFIVSLYMILIFYEKPSFIRLTAAVAFSSFAMLIKPYCIFLIYGAFISIAFHRQGIRKSFTNRNFLMFLLLSPLPGAFYYISGLLTHGAFLQEHAQASFLPHLLMKPYFWKDWLAMIARVVGLVPFVGALIGLFAISKGLSKTFLIGLWTGYCIFGLFFTFHIHTHDYYQLQLIPVVALTLGLAASQFASKLIFYRKYIIIIVVFLSFVLLGIIYNVNYIKRHEDSRYLKIFGYFMGINPQFYKFIDGDFEKEVKAAQEIGTIVHHSTNTIFLTSDYGRSLTYHGELSGLPWPTSTSFEERKDRGIRVAQKEELYNGRYFVIRTHAKFIRYTPDYFIITDFEEFRKQPDLIDFLKENYPLLSRSDDYLIYDLHKMKLLRERDEKDNE